MQQVKRESLKLSPVSDQNWFHLFPDSKFNFDSLFFTAIPKKRKCNILPFKISYPVITTVWLRV